MLYKNGLKLLRNWLWLKITWKNEQKILIWHFGICLGQCRTDGREYALNLRPITGAGFWKTSLTKVDNYHAKNLKKQTKTRYHSSKVNFFCSFFGRFDSTKKTFPNQLTFSGKNNSQYVENNFECNFWKKAILSQYEMSNFIL